MSRSYVPRATTIGLLSLLIALSPVLAVCSLQKKRTIVSGSMIRNGTLEYLETLAP
jgi:hypothetical protein